MFRLERKELDQFEFFECGFTKIGNFIDESGDEQTFSTDRRIKTGRWRHRKIVER